MTREEFWKGFTNDEIVVHTPKKEQSISFLKECRDRGIQVKMNDEQYYVYGTETCIGINTKNKFNFIDQLISSSIGFLDKWISYGDKEDLACGHCEIIEYDEVFGGKEGSVQKMKTTAELLGELMQVAYNCEPYDVFVEFYPHLDEVEVRIYINCWGVDETSVCSCTIGLGKPVSNVCLTHLIDYINHLSDATPDPSDTKNVETVQ